MQPISPAKLARHPALFAAWLMSLLLVFALFESGREAQPKFGPHAQIVIGLPDGVAADDLDEVFPEDPLGGARTRHADLSFSPKREHRQPIAADIDVRSFATDVERARGPPAFRA